MTTQVLYTSQCIRCRTVTTTILKRMVADLPYIPQGWLRIYQKTNRHREKHELLCPACSADFFIFMNERKTSNGRRAVDDRDGTARGDHQGQQAAAT